MLPQKRADFVALEGEHDAVRPLVSRHQLESGAEHRVHRGRIGDGRAARRAGHELVLKNVGEGLLPGVGSDEAYAGFAVRAAEPVKLAAVELGLHGADDRIDGDRSFDHADLSAVGWRAHGHVVGGDQAAGAAHVAHDHGRRARDVFAHVPCNDTRIEIVSAAGIEPDHNGNLPAIEELLDRFRTGRSGQHGQEQQGYRGNRSSHPFLSWTVHCNSTVQTGLFPDNPPGRMSRRQSGLRSAPPRLQSRRWTISSPAPRRGSRSRCRRGWPTRRSSPSAATTISIR